VLSLVSVKTIVALLALVLFALVAGTREKPHPQSIEGYVYETCSADELAGPIEGAVVSTSVDDTTAITDSNGHFRLSTKGPVYSDEFYNVSVRAARDVTVDDNFLLNNGVSTQPRQVGFVLSPPHAVVARFDTSRDRIFCQDYPPRRAGTTR
jgi:hypothetical protein